MFIDIHSHLDICKNIDGVIKNARDKNVKVLTYGTTPSSNRKILELKHKFPEINVALGIYPTDALNLSEDEINSEIEFIKKNKDKVIAIGEVGIDLKENSEQTLETQKANLKKFVDLARELKIPVVIHSRKAEKECVELLEKLNYNKIIMHCFSGNMKLVDRIIQNKWFLTAPTNIKHSEHFQKMIERTPIEQLFCETDSPFLHPDKLRDNEPANVIESYNKIAEIKKMSLDEVEKIIEMNYKRLFKS